MATKPKKSVKPAGDPLTRKSVQVEVREKDSPEVKAGNLAKLVMSSEFAAYRVLSSADGKSLTSNEIDVPSLVNEIRAQAAAVSSGDFVHVESMLMNQAGALQTLFVRLTERAMAQERIPNFEGFMRMALRAQSQCRATLETLAAIKNPPVVFAKQTNINQGNGNQQVNNGIPAPASHAGKTINQQNELLEVQHGSETLDGRATGATIGKDKAMATLGQINRGEDT